MTEQPVHTWLERGGRLLRLRLARPKANILDGAMIAALRGALDTHLDQPALNGVLLDAEGPHFSFGASVEEHLPEQCAGMLRAMHALIVRMFASPVPVLVAIRGQCLGGGLELAASAHLLFAAPDARLGQPEIKLAVFAPAASCLLPERIARAHAEDLLFSGRSISATEAQGVGLLNAVVDNPEATALAYFDEHLMPLSASSLRLAVQAARAEAVDRLTQRLAAVEELYLSKLMATRDAVEGLQAFLEKRVPTWEHH
jgi:cyclohexa-1,5-dienecarbonyl-CoA hydratase